MTARFLRLLLVAVMLALASCTLPTVPTTATRLPVSAAILLGRDRAMACGAAQHLPLRQPFARLRFWADPTTDLAGYARGRDVVVLTRLVDYPVVWSHEILHALYGLPGHTATDHPPVFWACGLDPRQW